MGLIVALLAAGVIATPAGAQQAPTPCVEHPGYRLMDFWVGEWSVEVEGEEVGTNRITKILDGCAITEEWVDARGGEGRSLFYFVPAADEWRQVWVTERATAPGGTKEKRLVERLDGGALRFQGTITLPDGRSYLDRTTLTPLDDGRVRQHIEISTDDGESWRSTFDAVYLPAG